MRGAGGGLGIHGPWSGELEPTAERSGGGAGGSAGRTRGLSRSAVMVACTMACHTNAAHPLQWTYQPKGGPGAPIPQKRAPYHIIICAASAMRLPWFGEEAPPCEAWHLHRATRRVGAPTFARTSRAARYSHLSADLTCRIPLASLLHWPTKPRVLSESIFAETAKQLSYRTAQS